ncbi:MAG: hypothetical protein ABIY70_15485 [Capsulimonas sp.]|uniref:hypothetical protein n=1 Tax=Capsulimonas sp. TaxID=2494211 RepID=UPI003262F5C9
MATTQCPPSSDYHGDTLTPVQRSERMGRVRGQNTKPEMAVRKLLHSLGNRCHLHTAELPGKPDIVFRKRCKAIFVHGCFWRLHEGWTRNQAALRDAG